MNRFFNRTNKSALSEWWWTVDRGLLLAIFSLAIFGIALVATASPPVAVRIGLDHSYFTIRHILLVIPSLFIMLAVSVLDARNIRRLGILVLAFSTLCMMLIPFIGMDIKGAQRWLHLPGLSLQPSELMKPSFAIVAAWLIAHHQMNKKFPGNFLSAGLFFLMISLLMIQPDFGMTIVLTCMFAAIIFVAGLPFRYLAFFGIVGIIGVTLVYASFDHVQSRIDRFLNPESGDTYQVDKSLEAFANGGFIGMGPGQGVVKNTIPDAHADFIFSVAGEELGLLFTIVIVALYAFILMRGYNRLMETNDMFVVLTVCGILAMIGLQAIVHMGSSLHLLPTKGMTLPFISYGGSSTLAIGFSFGVILGLTRRQARSSIAKSGLNIFKKTG
jgi:cell division protein FtsW